MKRMGRPPFLRRVWCDWACSKCEGQQPRVVLLALQSLRFVLTTNCPWKVEVQVRFVMMAGLPRKVLKVPGVRRSRSRHHAHPDLVQAHASRVNYRLHLVAPASAAPLLHVCKALARRSLSCTKSFPRRAIELAVPLAAEQSVSVQSAHSLMRMCRGCNGRQVWIPRLLIW